MKTLQRLTDEPVFWVVLPLFMVLLPHLPRIPLWMVTLVSILLLWRVHAIFRPGVLPPKWLLLIIAVLAAAGSLIHYGTLFGKTAGTAILSILLAIKLLESRQRRDFMLLIALSFFIIVTNFLFSQSIPTVLYMLTTVIVLVASLVTINQDQAPLSVKSRLNLSFKLVLQALPIMLVLFVLFPRVPGPLWKLPDDRGNARIGLSDSMTPGSIAQLIESNEVAFRVAFDQSVPAQKDLYWRAQVFWQFDGRTWEHGDVNQTPTPVMEGFARATSYTVTLEPHDRNWLFALDMPGETAEDTRYNSDFMLRSTHKVTTLMRYRLTSYLNYRIGNRLGAWERAAGLRLPANSNPRTIELGRRWRKQFQQPEAIVHHALRTFNKQEYHYTLRPPMTPGFDPVDQFLFDTRAGFCEHYASSFTLLMRAAGIPARVITGYQGGTYNPLNHNLTVRQSDAHAWSEVWLAGKGWVRIDPTAAIAPERIERSLNAALAENEFRPLYMRMDNGVFRKIRFYWDALDSRWNQFVIGYDPQLQRQFLSSLMNRDVDFRQIVMMLGAGLTLAILFSAFFLFKPKHPGKPDPYQHIYHEFCRKLARKGLARASHEGPQAFASRAIEKFPQRREPIRLITGIYINARYRSRGNQRQLGRMKTLVRGLRLF